MALFQDVREYAFMFGRKKRNSVSIDAVVIERIEITNWLWEAARASQTGLWQCLRCGSEHSADGEAPIDYWRVDEGPHVCTSCGSWAYTVPAPAPDNLMEYLGVAATAPDNLTKDWHLGGAIDANQAVSGESHYMDALEAILGPSVGGHSRERAIIAVLVPEPDNQYDPNALMVIIDRQQVGYIPKDDAPEIGRRLDGKPIAVAARVGAEAAPGSAIGVRIELLWEDSHSYIDKYEEMEGYLGWPPFSVFRSKKEEYRYDLLAIMHGSAELWKGDAPFAEVEEKWADEIEEAKMMRKRYKGDYEAAQKAGRELAGITDYHKEYVN